MYRLAREEMESTVNWCATDTNATIDTADPSMIRKLDRLVEQYSDVYKCTRVDSTCHAKMYSLPVRFIRFRKPVSTAQREAARLNGRVTRFDTANPPLRNTSAALDVQTPRVEREDHDNGHICRGRGLE